MSETTPMMQQYLKIKSEYKDALLFYRMGDFYELFFEDAEIASQALDIHLTKRGSHKGDPIPMCGVPHHSHESYLMRLIKLGHKVAICEQTEDPKEAKKRGHKAVVRREVVRLITAGTITEDKLLDSTQNNFLVSILRQKDLFGVAAIDLSTGEFYLQNLSMPQLHAAISKLNPAEILVSDQLIQVPELFELFELYRSKLTLQPDTRFNLKNCHDTLKAYYKLETLESFGAFELVELAAGGGLLEYISLTQKDNIPNFAKPQSLSDEQYVDIDPSTLSNLEILRTQKNELKGSLFHTVNCTLTSSGARLLSNQLIRPLKQVAAVNKRLDQVEFFYKHHEITEVIRGFLKLMPDIERPVMRVMIGRGTPRDLKALQYGLEQADNTRLKLLFLEKTHQANPHYQYIYQMVSKCHDFGDQINVLKRALKDELPLHARDGGFIRETYSDALDGFVKLRDQSRQHVLELQAKYQKAVNIQAIKIKHNNVLGYFVEAPSKYADQLMGAQYRETFIHRQTLANAIRFTTVELSELEQSIRQAGDKALALELEIFDQLIEDISHHRDALKEIANTMAQIDVMTSLAVLAREHNYIRPRIDASDHFEIKKGRHPVVEKFIKVKNSEEFIANDCMFDRQAKLHLLTGPNMAGKSTYLRQNILIALLAQICSFVPAEFAHIGVVDKIFSRVGASDDLARGQSTFMVEMIETAAILNQATERSLVVLDEIGRGTSTYDGLSIAWAVIEYLHDKLKCRTLFATHYHELTSLEKTHQSVKCYTMKITEWKEEIIFVHKVIEGIANRSYGVHVAKIAGVPKEVIARASILLTELESNKVDRDIGTQSAEILPLFSKQTLDFKEDSKKDLVFDEMIALKLDGLTPKEALDILYSLQRKACDVQKNEFIA